ncbi:MAG: TRAP transporter small permease subunit [bacterium]
MRVLRTLEDWLTSAERVLTVGILVFMVGMAFLQVVLRNVFSSSHLGWLQAVLRFVGFNGGILWAESLLKFLVLWIGLLGAMLAASSDRQFAMDVAQRLLHGRVRHVVAGVCHAFTAAVSAVLAWAALEFWREEFADGSALFSIGTFKMPAWTFEVILPGGFFLLTVHYLIKICEPWMPQSSHERGEPV